MKKIAIIGHPLGDNSFGMTKPYLEYLSQFGQVEIVTPRKGIMECDLLVLGGGPDTNPANYNQVPSYYTENACVMREYFFRNNLKQYIDAKIPILGICLGMQELNIHFGGSLLQHWNFGRSSPRFELIETLNFTKEFNEIIVPTLPVDFFKPFMVKLKDKEEKILRYGINTLHHQGIYHENLSKEFTVLGTSSICNNVELFMHKKLNIFGVQFHPEEFNCKLTNHIINNFLLK